MGANNPTDFLLFHFNLDLYDFLDLQLGCFSRNSNMDITSKRFVPPGEDWTVLVEVIDLLNQNKVCKLMRAHIGYLRQGFSSQ